MSIRTSLRAAAVTAATASSMAYLHAASAATALQNFQGNIVNTSNKAGIQGSQNDLGGLAGSLINSALGLLGILFVVLIIYAGYLWMTAQGDDKKVGDAKKIIQQAAIGLVVIFASYAIVNTVLTSIEKTTIMENGETFSEDEVFGNP